MKTLEELTEEYNLAQRMVLDKTIEITLVQQGIDPEKVAMRDFDNLRRLSVEIDNINDKTAEKIAAIRQEADARINAICTELGSLSQEIKEKLEGESL